MNSIMDKETLENVLENPIFYFNEHYIYTDVFKDLNNFKNAIEELKINKEYSKYKLLFHMINFKNIYEKFRPQSITSYDSYYGTVKLIEEVFVILFNYIDMEILFTFSKIHNTYYKNGNYSHDDIDWDSIIGNVGTIIESVILAITEKAIELLCILKDDTPYYCERIIKVYIQKVLPEVSYENIKFNYKNNKLLISEKNIEIGNYRKIILEIYKIKENDL